MDRAWDTRGAEGERGARGRGVRARRSRTYPTRGGSHAGGRDERPPTSRGQRPDADRAPFDPRGGRGKSGPGPAAAPNERAPGQPERLGIFGGSFDPVHAGHLHAARAALAAFELDRVLFVPAARPPHKPGRELAPAAARVAMLELACRGEPRFAVDPLELERSGPSYTIDTLREIEAREVRSAPELFLILGSDNLPGLATWRSAAELLRRVQPIVVHRGDEAEPALADLRARLGASAAARVERGLLRLPPVEVSATELRAALRTGRDPGPALPPGVYRYVREHGLYGAAQSGTGA